MPRLSHEDDLIYGAKYRADHRELLRAKGRDYYAKNKERLCERGKRTWHQRIYGISPRAVKLMLDHQHGLCALCFKPPLPGDKLVLDHDHNDNRIRGFLCRHCNSSLA